MDELQKYTPASIAKITDVKDAVKLKIMADAANVFYRAQDDRIEAQKYKEWSMLSARRAGEILAETPREQGKRTDLDTSSTKYAKLLDYTGISASTARNWQKMARIPEDKFLAYFDEAEFMNWEFTHYSLLRYAEGKPPTSLNHKDWLRIARGYCQRLQGSAASIEIQLAARRFLDGT
jgi:hypothetical protein